MLSQDRKRQVEERKERETAKSLEILKELEKEKQRAEKKEKEKEQKQKVSLIEEVEEDGKLNASFNMSSLSKKKEVTPTKVGEVDTRQTLTEVSSTTENSANVQTTPAAATAKIQECLPVENIMDYINDLD